MSLREVLMEALRITDEKVLRQLEEMASIRQFKKGEILFNEGEIPSFVPLLLSGAVRGFLVDYTGKDVTNCFNTRRFDPLVPSIPLDAPAIVSMESLMDSEALCLPTDRVVQMMRNDPRLFEYYNRLLLASLRTQIEIKNVLYKYTAMERYEWFLKNYPGLDGKISSKYIASFLNITTVSLSRLRTERKNVQIKKSEESII